MTASLSLAEAARAPLAAKLGLSMIQEVRAARHVQREHSVRLVRHSARTVLLGRSRMAALHHARHARLDLRRRQYASFLSFLVRYMLTVAYCAGRIGL
jgi:hypothetical protein